MRKSAAEMISEIVPLGELITASQISDLVKKAGYDISVYSIRTAVLDMYRGKEVELERTFVSPLYFYRFIEFKPEFYERVKSKTRVKFEGYELTQAEKKLVNFVRENDGTVSSICAEELNISINTIPNYLVKLFKL